jgi:hypothetical protein
MKKALLAALILAGTILLENGGLFAQGTSGPSITDLEIQLLRKDLRSQKKQIIAANMQLTDDEAQKFWPVYDQYTADTTKINDYRTTLVKEYAENYAGMTENQAESLLTRWTVADESILALRLKYIPIFNKVLPVKKVVRFFQLDRRIGMMMEIQLASAVPLLQP